jgi:hypothetical protein
MAQSARQLRTCYSTLLTFAVATAAICSVVGVCSALGQPAQRPLNPRQRTSLDNNQTDRFFKIAFDAANLGDFNTAIINYGRASLAASSDCDKAHASAGKGAAVEANDLYKKSGWASRPTQFFWLRIQELTKSLPCVYVR